MMTEDEHGELKALAWRTLKAVDHIDAKAEDEGLTISPAWRDWRRSVRAVIRGELMEIPNEPARYTGDAFKAHWDAVTSGKLADAVPFVDARDAEIEALRKRIAELEAPPVVDGDPPAEVMAEARPDEDYTELKARLLLEFASLRNMLVGHIPMTPDELARLVALEHPKYQSWLQGVTHD